ncbi:MAG: DEAD/DEAH box helicase [Candidatus Eremiobacteraeota bacterium]|nr:DEAD/DEAH box helicase [Candidatus Eremiobacteraeota bacterium]
MLDDFSPLVRDWFERRFGAPTEPQRFGWPQIRAGRDVLITAPTGSGKTLSAFLICLDDLIRRAGDGGLPDATLVVYVSPLRALTNDVQRNLEGPLAQIAELAVERGEGLAPIRTAVRTGDTTESERAKMLRTPPHILVTTPESLFIFLTAERSRQLLKSVHTVIVDEIHAMVDAKRGSHLALTLARLDHLVTSNGGRKPQRIGLSATVKPIEPVAAFLSPGAAVVDIGHRRALELKVEVPADELGPVASNEMWGDVYDRVAALIQEHRTTLIFVGTRRMAERATYALQQRLGEGVVLPHHGSLSRTARFVAEQRLKGGELRAVVATASLELGIDIGTVDLVVQLGAPRAIATALQRIGRSGHWIGAVPKGVFFALTRDELLECAALVRTIREGKIDALDIPRAPLDILSQQIVAACAADDWREDDLFAVVRAAYPYRDLSRAEFDEVVSMLAEGIATSRGRSGTFLHHDRVNRRLRGRRGARIAAVTSGGAIPDIASYAVVAEPEGTTVGSLDEDFAIESMAGDIFLLGTTSWRIKRVEQGIVRVEDAQGAPPSIPFWNGEGPGRTIELSREVARLREEIAKLEPADAQRLLIEECLLDAAGAEQAIAYVRAGKAILGAIPTQDTLVAERFFDEGGGMQLILHTPFGARINRAWGLALRKRFCRSFNFELQAAATDNGIVLSLTDQHAFPLDAVWEFLKTASVREVLTQALLPAPMFAARWRWNAMRALAILRFSGGRKVPPQLLRMRAEDLLAAVFPDQVACAENLQGEIRIPDHVLVRETIENCLREAMDVDGFVEILGRLERGEITTVSVDTPEPSPFCHEILNANPYAYLDDAPLEERRARAVTLRRTLRGAVDAGDGVGILDAEAIAEVARESWPDVRDADELHDALLTLIVVPPVEAWREYFETLVAEGRAATLSLDGGASLWISAERLGFGRLLYPSAAVSPALREIAPSRPVPETVETAFAEVLRGWLESSGPVTVDDLAARFAQPAHVVATALAQLQGEGQVLPGRFSGADADEWCNRRILARIHRLTLGRLRREIEPASSADFMRFLLRWQHVALGTRLHGVDGLLQVIKQLEGYEIPAIAWERQILPARVAAYKADYLDELCHTGEVMWGRLSPHPASATLSNGQARKRIRPNRLGPISFFLREHAPELKTAGGENVPLSDAARDVLAAVDRTGAPFFSDIVRESGRLPAEVEESLWELASAGFVTADRFDSLRALIDTKRRLGEKGRRQRPRAAGGRWTRLVAGSQSDPEIEAARAARRLLARWGVVFRDLVAREEIPPWRDVLRALRRMEAQGEIRGGRFVAGYVGEQFALPEALDALRAVRRSGPCGEEITIAASDPLNLIGVILPGSRASANAAGTIALIDGVPAENRSSDVRWLREPPVPA